MTRRGDLRDWRKKGWRTAPWLVTQFLLAILFAIASVPMSLGQAADHPMPGPCSMQAGCEAGRSNVQAGPCESGDCLALQAGPCSMHCGLSAWAFEPGERRRPILSPVMFGAAAVRLHGRDVPVSTGPPRIRRA